MYVVMGVILLLKLRWSSLLSNSIIIAVAIITMIKTVKSYRNYKFAAISYTKTVHTPLCDHAFCAPY